MNVKKILIAIGGVIATIIGVLIGRGMSHRRGVRRVADDLREVGESVERAGSGIEDVADQLRDSRDTAGRIAERNRDNKADVDRAKEILSRAKQRSRRDRPDNRLM